MTLEEYFGRWLEIIDQKDLLKYRNMLMQAALNSIDIEPSGMGTVFKCFNRCKFEDLKAVIVGQDPYFDGSATGLAFGNDPSRKGFKDLSPSLKVLKNSVLSLSEPEENPIFDPTLESWAKQGILLLNSALTVRHGKPGSHVEAWRPFIQKLLTGISAETNACFLMFGKQAWSFKDGIFDNEKGVFLEYHPAYYARNGIQMPNTIWKQMLEYVRKTFGTDLKLYE